MKGITYKDIENAVKQLKEYVPDKLLYAGVCPDGVYRVIPVEEYGRMIREEQQKKAAQS